MPFLALSATSESMLSNIFDDSTYACKLGSKSFHLDACTASWASFSDSIKLALPWANASLDSRDVLRAFLSAAESSDISTV